MKRDSLPLVVDLRKRNAIHFPKQRFWERGCKVALHATALAVETRLAKILIPLRDNLGASRPMIRMMLRSVLGGMRELLLHRYVFPALVIQILVARAVGAP